MDSELLVEWSAQHQREACTWCYFLSSTQSLCSEVALFICTKNQMRKWARKKTEIFSLVKICKNGWFISSLRSSVHYPFFPFPLILSAEYLTVCKSNIDCSRQPRSLWWYHVPLIPSLLVLTDVMDRALHIANYLQGKLLQLEFHICKSRLLQRPELVI